MPEPLPCAFGACECCRARSEDLFLCASCDRHVCERCIGDAGCAFCDADACHRDSIPVQPFGGPAEVAA